jgi:hypothetical protein
MKRYRITTITIDGQRSISFGLFKNDWDAIDHSLTANARRVIVRRMK